MQKIIEFKKKSFWSSQVDIDVLNEKISELNKNGWVIKSITSNSSLFGIVMSYTLFIELKD